MQPTAREIPAGRRYFSVDHADLDSTASFRFPDFLLAARLLDVLSAGTGGSFESAMRMRGLLIGAFWFHPQLEVEAQVPSDLSSGWEVYGQAVLDELQDADWSLRAVVDVALELKDRLVDGMAVSAAATEDATGN